MANKKKNQRGTLIATSGNDKLYYVYTKISQSGDKLKYGYVEKPNGVVIDDVPIDSILARGYWIPVEVSNKQA